MPFVRETLPILGTLASVEGSKAGPPPEAAVTFLTTVTSTYVDIVTEW